MRDSLELLIRAGNPLIAIETTDEDRATQLVRSVVLPMQQKLYEWSLTTGLRPVGDGGPGRALVDGGEVMPTLEHIPNIAQRSVFVFKDLGPHCRDAMVHRTIRDLLRLCTGTKSTLILIDALPLPEEIKRFTIRFEVGWPDAEELEQDIAPFRALASHPLGMTGHLMFPAWDDAHPATQSPTIIERVIRGAIGFDGLLLTDDIDMEALEGSVPERSERALAAGCDVTLNCWAKIPDMEGIASRNPDLSDAARARLDRVLEAIGPLPDGFETAELVARRDAFFAAARDAA